MGLVGVKYGLVYSRTYNMGMIKTTVQYVKVMLAEIIIFLVCGWVSEFSRLLDYFKVRVLNLN